MAIVNVGSINVDHVYRVPHFTQPGETQAARSHQQGLGGKGVNQSIAALRAGAHVVHVGATGEADSWLHQQLDAAGVDQRHIHRLPGASGHAVIEVDDAGENAILIYGGANQALHGDMLKHALDTTADARWVLTQNETNLLRDTLAIAAAQGCKLAFSPAPFDPSLGELDLSNVALLVLNEIEVCQMAGADNVDDAVSALQQRYDTALVVTLGGDGVRYHDANQTLHLPAKPVTAVDTTAAGDTFLGYLLAAIDNNQPIEAALERATQAAALCVTRPGAAAAIPFARELS